MIIGTNNTTRLLINKDGYLSINTTSINSQLNINSSTGTCLRLIYNNSGFIYDLNVDSSGNLVLSPYANILSSKKIILESDTLAYLNMNSISLFSGSVINSKIGVNYTLGGLTIGNSSNHKMNFITNNYEAMRINDDSSIGLDSSSIVKQLNINSYSGDCLRLIYNNSSGTETVYSDLDVLSGGDLQISSTSGYIDLQGLKLLTVAVSATATELNYNDITTLGIAQASKTLTSNSSLNTTGINLLNCTTLQVNSSLTDAQVNIRKDQNAFTSLNIVNHNLTLDTAGSEIRFVCYRYFRSIIIKV
jgi:hypothetical protein